jgi:hypothetical protein
VVGGFAMAPATRAAPPPPPPPPTQSTAPGTIAGAMRTPAAPPPTQRPIIKHMAPAIEPEGDEHTDAAGGEPEATESAIPSDLNKLFSNLMTG